MTSAALAPLLSFFEARRPQVRAIQMRRGVENPVTGHHAKLIQDAKESTDHAVVFEFTIPPRSQGAPLHFHTRITEDFCVISGKMLMEIGGAGNARVLVSGDRAMVRPGVLHSFRNSSDVPLVLRCQVTPGEDFVSFIRATYELAIEGHTDTQGLPTSFWHSVLLVEWGDMRHPLIPTWIQIPVVRVLARIARNTRAGKRLLASLPSSGL